jgi:hypothetical protein
MAAAAGLAATPVAAAFAGPAKDDALLMPICGDATHLVVIPLKGDRPAPGKDCPAGCHAMCSRRLDKDDGDGDL